MQNSSARNDFLSILQEGFPLATRPFDVLSKTLGISEQEAINLYRELKDEGVIRQTSAILDTKKLGYDSSLVAFMTDPNKIDQIAAIISSHPGVSHNYKRSHDYNLWFTLAVAPNSLLGLSKTVEKLASQAGVEGHMILPTLKMFKIAVKLDVNKTKSQKEKVAKKEHKDIPLTQEHYSVIAEIQADIQPKIDPFSDMAAKLHMTEERLFALIDDLSQGGYMRRFATILNHRQAGFSSNAMVVWNIPDDTAMEQGAKSAEFSAVSHCYLRPRAGTWNYNLFTMIHASSQEELESTISDISKELDTKDYRALHSLHEYKKVRIKYFTSDYYDWERQWLNF